LLRLSPWNPTKKIPPPTRLYCEIIFHPKVLFFVNPNEKATQKVAFSIFLFLGFRKFDLPFYLVEKKLKILRKCNKKAFRRAYFCGV
jgi:hypothetical protein